MASPQEIAAARRELARRELARREAARVAQSTAELPPVPQPLPVAVQPVPTLGDVSLEAQAEARKAAEEAADPFRSVLTPDAYQRRVEADSALIEAELERRQSDGLRRARAEAEPRRGFLRRCADLFRR